MITLDSVIEPGFSDRKARVRNGAKKKTHQEAPGHGLIIMIQFI